MATKRMNPGETKPRQIRIPENDWEHFKQLADLMETERAALVRQFITWFIRHPGAKLPPRPTVEQVRSVHASESTPGAADQP